MSINDPINWLDYEDSGEKCPDCGRPPFRYFEFDNGETVYQCSCGGEWMK